MAGKTPSAAVENFVNPLKATIGAFCHGVVRADKFAPNQVGVLSLEGGNPVPIGRSNVFQVSVSMRYEIVPRDEPDVLGVWQVTTRGWMYSIYENDAELLAFHWHPISNSHSVEPHVHVGDWDKTRQKVPTGRVFVEDVLRYCQQCLEVTPLSSDWDKTLAANRSNVALGATWGHPK